MGQRSYRRRPGSSKHANPKALRKRQYVPRVGRKPGRTDHADVCEYPRSFPDPKRAFCSAKFKCSGWKRLNTGGAIRQYQVKTNIFVTTARIWRCLQPASVSGHSESCIFCRSIQSARILRIISGRVGMSSWFRLSLSMISSMSLERRNVTALVSVFGRPNWVISMIPESAIDFMMP